jgi:hypothetical protein
MTWLAIAEVIVVIWFFFHVPIIILIVYWLVFRQWPFPKGYKWSEDLKLLNSFRKAIMENLSKDDSKNLYHGEGDYYDDYDGTGSDSGPTIRHPKNRNRAYSGSSERFDDGGW